MAHKSIRCKDRGHDTCTGMLNANLAHSVVCSAHRHAKATLPRLQHPGQLRVAAPEDRFRHGRLACGGGGLHILYVDQASQDCCEASSEYVKSAQYEVGSAQSLFSCSMRKVWIARGSKGGEHPPCRLLPTEPCVETRLHLHPPAPLLGHIA